MLQKMTGTTASSASRGALNRAVVVGRRLSAGGRPGVLARLGGGVGGRGME